MTRTVLFYHVNAFTQQPFTGNPAAVVLNADSLSDREMQLIARELKNSETAFVLSAEAPDHDIRIRFFTPTTEVPSCGHATLAAHYVRAKVHDLPPMRVRHKTGAGLLHATIARTDQDHRITVSQATPLIGDPLGEDDRSELLRALGLQQRETETSLPIMRIDTGHSKVMIPVRSRSVLDTMTPDLPKLAQLSRRWRNGGYVVFTLNEPDPDVTSHCRVFSPASGIPEDPVTGNGHGALGAYLVANGVAPRDGQFHFFGRQGEGMGRSGTVEVWVEARGGCPVSVEIGGPARILFEGRFFL